MDTKNQIEQLLAGGQTKEAIQELKEAVLHNPSLSSELLLLESEFNRLERTKRTNTEDSEKLRLAENKITQGLIKICSAAFNVEEKTDATEKRRLTNREVSYAIRYIIFVPSLNLQPDWEIARLHSLICKKPCKPPFRQLPRRCRPERSSKLPKLLME